MYNTCTEFSSLGGCLLILGMVLVFVWPRLRECGLLQCLQVAVKVCRCGKREKQVSCSSEYLCEGKCSQLRQCGRHQCRRKVGRGGRGEGEGERD